MNPTHTLTWSPPYMCGSGSTGLWVLGLTEGETLRGCFLEQTAEFGRNTSKDALTQWVTTQLGYQVILVNGEQTIRVHRFGRLRREPMFWVYPVVTP